MKQIIIILIISFFSVSNVIAEAELLPEGTSVNQLLNEGYKLVDTGEVSWIDSDDNRKVGVIYHLMKGKNLVTCGMEKRQIECVKP